MSWFDAIVLAIVEGLTEYLPISSTGHLIVTSSFLGINAENFTKDYTIIVQFGAILSVLVVYWRRFLQPLNRAQLLFYAKLFVAFLPAAIIGLATSKIIDRLLGSVVTVAISFIVGGVILLFVDKWFAQAEQSPITVDKLDFKTAVKIGFFQCLALCPGMSRSAATIVGGMTQNLSRKVAAEFSFFLAVPTLTAATFYKVAKLYKHIEPQQISILIVGNVVSFIVGCLTISLFLGYLQRKGFKFFGYYRIIAGIIILILLATGHEMHDL